MRIVVLFNLKDGAVREDYEAWARSRDIPTVNALGSVDSFRVHQMTGLMMGDGKPPFDYIEIIDVADPDGFGPDISTEKMQAISAEFQQFADSPLFITTRELEA